MNKLVFIVILLFLSATSAWTAPRRAGPVTLDLPCSLGSHYPVFGLQMSESCRAVVTTGSERVCITKAELPSILSSPLPFCGTLLGRWKLFSPPEQSPDSKRVIRTFRLERFSDKPLFYVSTQTVSIARSLWFRVQKTRFELSEILRPWDPDCIVRALILGEQDHDSPAEFLRVLGFVHLFSATGIHLYALAAFISWMTGNLALAARLPARIALPLSRFGSTLFCGWAWLLGRMSGRNASPLDSYRRAKFGAPSRRTLAPSRPSSARVWSRLSGRFSSRRFTAGLRASSLSAVRRWRAFSGRTLCLSKSGKFGRSKEEPSF